MPLLPTFTTPMMRQYREIKKKYLDCLLFYRMGDFYELFMEDAYVGASILNITLTSKKGGKDGKIPMAGVPYHAADTYLVKLVKAGYKVAICEQLSPPNKKGLVERDVVRIVTPGTLLDENVLNKKENNYIISLLMENNIVAISASDLSTGYFATGEFEFDNLQKELQDELSRLHPSECILPDILYNDASILKMLKSEKGLNIFPFPQFEQFADNAKNFLCKHFGVSTLESFGIEEKEYSLKAAAALLGYLQDTQKGTLSHIKKISSFNNRDGLILDRSTMINLELFSTIREHDTKGSLLSILDQTVTAMGGRLLKQWMKKPLLDKAAIERRHNTVQAFLQNPKFQALFREQLKQIPDIERLLSRLSVNLGNARDLAHLKLSLEAILQTKKILEDSDDELIATERKNISPRLLDLVQRIETVIVSDPPISIKEGGMIKNGVSQRLDELRKITQKSKEFMLKLERTEREKTGIHSLKVKFNKVFGFYIEVSKPNLHLAPKSYMRKQTLVNGERFITEELKKHEEIILTAEEKINELEYVIFLQTLEYIIADTEHIQNAAESIAILDCLSSFSYLSEKEHYVRPKLLYSGEIRIAKGRHPVVENLLEGKLFVPNDTTLDNVTQTLLLITGPNMAGKSVYIRQVALIVLMAQMGCFVPAQSAHISLVDRIFVRSGASDVITSGLSTFMVEMVETAHILNNATNNSLIIMDEIGRGTSTYDGISIAWAVAEYLITHIKPNPKILFATHYHELQALEDHYPNRIKNFHLTATEEKGTPVFLHTILPGGASHSFGIAVAKLAGVPSPVIEKAKEILRGLERRNVEDEEINSTSLQPTLFDVVLFKELESIEIATTTPLEALQKLSQLKEKLKIIKTQKPFLEAD